MVGFYRDIKSLMLPVLDEFKILGSSMLPVLDDFKILGSSIPEV